MGRRNMVHIYQSNIWSRPYYHDKKWVTATIWLNHLLVNQQSRVENQANHFYFLFLKKCQTSLLRNENKCNTDYFSIFKNYAVFILREIPGDLIFFSKITTQRSQFKDNSVLLGHPLIIYDFFKKQGKTLWNLTYIECQ